MQALYLFSSMTSRNCYNFFETHEFERYKVHYSRIVMILFLSALDKTYKDFKCIFRSIQKTFSVIKSRKRRFIFE